LLSRLRVLLWPTGRGGGSPLPAAAAVAGDEPTGAWPPKVDVTKAAGNECAETVL